VEPMNVPEAGIALWRRLVARAAARGVPYADAQDLAGQAFLKALESFDGARGGFGPYCRTIHGNLLKNYWRDRKITVEIDPDSDLLADGRDPAEVQMNDEMSSAMRSIADKILADLNPVQAAFFVALSEVIGEFEYGAVSEAARRIGIEPLRGHDVYRQIQRKARKHLEEFASLVMAEHGLAARDVVEAAPEAPAAPAAEVVVARTPPREAPSADIAPGPPRAARLFGLRAAAPADPFVLLSARFTSAGFGRFEASLSEDARRRLVALLS